MKSAAYSQLVKLIQLFPQWAFPSVPFVIAACFQVFAWFGGRYLTSFTLIPRILILWLLALGEYGFMSPAMNASQEVLHMSENILIVMYNVATLMVFIIVSSFVFQNKFTVKHGIAIILMIIAVIIVYI
jgi:uncharacterized protein (DUF486 family)